MFRSQKLSAVLEKTGPQRHRGHSPTCATRHLYFLFLSGTRAPAADIRRTAARVLLLRGVDGIRPISRNQNEKRARACMACMAHAQSVGQNAGLLGRSISHD